MADTRTHGPEAVFHIRRTVNGPLNVVWKAYTEQEPLMQWFGPSGFCLRTPTDFEMWGKWTFVDNVAPHTLSMVVAFSDVNAGHASMAQGCNASFEQLDAYLAQVPRP